MIETYKSIEEAVAAWPECTHVLMTVHDAGSYAPALLKDGKYWSRDEITFFYISENSWEVAFAREPGLPQKPGESYGELVGTVNGLKQLLELPPSSTSTELFNTVDELTRVVQFPDRMEPRNKYDREILPRIHVDVYDVLNAFRTGSPEIDHAVKKLLVPGNRGHKNEITDLNEAMQSIQRRIDRLTEWSK